MNSNMTECDFLPQTITAVANRLPSISVIVPVRNEAAFIERTLGQLLAQDYDASRWEILLVDGESTDGTWARASKLAERHPALRLFRNPRRLSSAARNIGIRNARGEVVVIVDGHCELSDRHYLHKLAEIFVRSGADSVGRPQPLDVSGANSLQRAIAAARASWLGHHPDSHVYAAGEGLVPAKSVAVAYRRTVFDRLGGFDESFDACEDVEFNHRVDRAGLRCYLSPAVTVRYAPRKTLRGLFRQMFRYGQGRVRLARKHPETFSLLGWMPLFFCLGIVLGLPLSIVSSGMAMIYGAALCSYAGLVALASAQLAFPAGRIGLWLWLPAVFVTIHVASGAGMLLELLAGVTRRPSPASEV